MTGVSKYRSVPYRSDVHVSALVQNAKYFRKVIRKSETLRGGYCVVPSVNKGKRISQQVTVKQFKLDRFKVHLQVSSDFQISIDNRIRSSTTESAGNRTRSEKIFQENPNKTRCPASLRSYRTFGMRRKTMKDNGLWCNGYTDADCRKGPMSCCV